MSTIRHHLLNQSIETMREAVQEVKDTANPFAVSSQATEARVWELEQLNPIEALIVFISAPVVWIHPPSGIGSLKYYCNPGVKVTITEDGFTVVQGATGSKLIEKGPPQESRLHHYPISRTNWVTFLRNMVADALHSMMRDEELNASWGDKTAEQVETVHVEWAQKRTEYFQSKRKVLDGTAEPSVMEEHFDRYRNGFRTDLCQNWASPAGSEPTCPCRTQAKEAIPDSV